MFHQCVWVLFRNLIELVGLSEALTIRIDRACLERHFVPAYGCLSGPIRRVSCVIKGLRRLHGQNLWEIRMWVPICSRQLFKVLTELSISFFFHTVSRAFLKLIHLQCFPCLTFSRAPPRPLQDFASNVLGCTRKLA